MSKRQQAVGYGGDYGAWAWVDPETRRRKAQVAGEIRAGASLTP